MIKSVKKILKKKSFQEVIKYMVVGGIGTLIDFGLLYVLVEFAGVWYLLAAILSFVAAVINNYILNKVWTFQDKSNQFAKQFVQFLIVSIVGLSLNTAILYGLVEFAGVWYLLAKALAIIVVLFWNFFTNKYWTFKRC